MSRPALNLSAAYRYGVALVAVVTTAAIRFALDPVLGTYAPYLPFVFAVLLVARFEGRGPALLTTVLSAFSIEYFFIPPYYSWRIADPHAAAGLTLFVAVGVLTSLLLSQIRESLAADSRSLMLLRKQAELANLTPAGAAEWKAGSEDRSLAQIFKYKPHFVWLGAAVLILLIEAALFSAIWKQFTIREQWTIHTHEALEKIQSVYSAAKDAEAGQRSYLVTGADSDLRLYTEALKSIPTYLDNVQRFTADNPNQQSRIRELRPLIAEMADLLDEAIELQKAGFSAALKARLDRGREVMARIRIVTGAMQSEEFFLLQRRSRAAQATAAGMIAVMASGAGLLLIVLLAGSRTIDRYISRRRHDEEVRATLAAIVDHTDDAIIGKNLDGTILAWNRGAEKLYGYTAAEVIGRPVSILLPQDHADDIASILERLRNGKAVERSETVRVAKNGRHIDVSLTISPIRNGAGGLIGASTVAHDITDRKRAEAAAVERERMLRRFIQSAPVALAMFDRDMRYLAVSQRYLDDYQISSLDLPGRSHYEVFPEIPDEWREIYRRCLTGTIERNPGEPFRRANGSEQWLRWELQPWRDANGAIGGLILFSEDITEQKLVERLARENETRFRELFESLSEGCMLAEVVCDGAGQPVDFRYLEANPALGRMFGHTREEIVGQTYHELFPGVSGDYWIQGFGQVALTGQPAHLKNYGEGSRRHFEVSAYSPQPGLFAAVLNDVSERKEAERAARESEEQFRTLANSIPQLCWMAEADGAIFWYNQRWYDYTGTTAEQMGGWGWQSVHDPAAQPDVMTRWQDSVATGSPFDMVVSLRGADATFRPFLTRVLPVRDEAGRIVRWFGTSTDISEQRNIEDALRESCDRELARAAELRAIMDAMPVAAFIARDAECREMIGNAMTYELLRRPPGSNLSTPVAFRALRNGQEIPASELPARRCAATGETVRNEEFDLLFPDGARRSLIGNAVPLRDAGGQRRGAVGVFIDITERKQAEDRLQESESLLRAVMDTVGDNIYLKDRDSRMLLVNPAVLRAFGKSEAEVLGKATEFFPDATAAAAVLQNDRETMDCNETMVFEETFRTAKGERVFLSNKSPWRDREGRVIGVVGVSTDITERKRAADALRESEERVRRKLESILSPDTDIGEIELHDIIDTEAIQSMMNDFFELTHVPMGIIGAKGEVVIGAGWQEICTRYHRLHPDTQRNCIESDTALAGGVPADEFKFYKCKNNLYDAATPFIVGGRHLGNTIAGQFLLDGEPVDHRQFASQARMYGFDEKEYLAALDLVPRINRKTAERAISFLGKLGGLLGELGYANIKLAKSMQALDRTREAAAQLSEQRGLALEAASQGAWEYNFKTGEVFWDEQCRKIFGVAADEQIPWAGAIARIHCDDREAISQAIEHAIATANGGCHREFRVVWPDGSEHWVVAHGRVRFEGDDGERCAARFVGVTADITDRKRAENEILELNANLERRVQERTAELLESNRELESFSYSVSHDLRGPLRAVEGFSRILLRDYPGKVLDETAADLMRRMSAATSRMGQLIGDLLTLSRIARQEITRQPVNLSELANGILAELRYREPQRQVKTGIQAGLFAFADPRLARVALENLLGNAWKYTGKTAAAAIAFGFDAGAREPAFFIRDNGAGFDMAHSANLFAPFQRLHRNDEFEGNGIGLATVQRVVRRHGGQIWAEGAVGEGAAFYFTLGDTTGQTSAATA